MSKLIKRGKRIIAVGVTLTTIVWAIGGISLFATPVAFAAVSGDLIKLQCTGNNVSVCSSVYYLGGDNKRYVFPNEKTYMTWYSDFSSLTIVSQTEMESYGIGGNVTYRPGVKMIKITTDPKVYAVEKNGTLRWVESEAVAMALYGANWNQMIDDVPDPFFVNYTVGSSVSEASQYDKDAQTAGSPTINDDKDLGSVTGSGSTLTVALAPDTPAAGLLIGSTALVPMTKVLMTASCDGDITVDSVTIERGGPAQDAAFSSFDLVDDSDDSIINNFSKSLTSAHKATFGDDFVVEACQTREIVVTANMASGARSAQAGEVPFISVGSVALKGGAALVGTLPISGNGHTVNGTLTGGTATITNGSNNPSATTKEIGTQNYVVSSIKLTNNSTATAQDFTVSSLTWTNNGSSAPDDVENAELLNTNTGEVLGTIASPDSDKLHFTGLDLLIKKGNNVNLDLRLDIKSGSARTISYDVDQQSHMRVFDMLRGYNVLPSYPNTSSPFYDANNTSIGDGKLRIESVTVTPNKIAENTNGVLLGKFKFVMDGEIGNITALGLKVTTSTNGTAHSGSDLISDLTNLTIKDPDGNTVAGPQDPTADAANLGFTATTTDTISVPVGDTIYEIYGDLSSDWTTDDTIQIGIHPGAITMKGDVSGNTITATPGSLVNSTSMQVKAASLTTSLDSFPGAQTVVAGTQDFTIARVVLDASNSGSDLRVTQFLVEIRDSSAMPSIVSGIEIWDGGTEVPVDTSSQTCSGATCDTADSRATTTLSITAGNLTIPKGTTKVITVVGDIGTGSTSGSFTMKWGAGKLTLIDSEAQSVTDTATSGSSGSMSLESGGTLQISLASDPSADLVIAGSTRETGKFLAKAKFEGMIINDFGFEVRAPDGGIVGNKDEVDSIELWLQGGSSAITTVPVVSANATLTPPGGYPLAIDEEKTFIVKTKFSTLSTGGGAVATSGSGVELLLSNVDVDGTATGSSSVTVNGTGTDFKTFTVFKSLPTVAYQPVSNSITGNAEYDLFRFSVTADGAGPIALAKFTYEVNTTTVGLATTTLQLFESVSQSVNGNQLAKDGDFFTFAQESETKLVIDVAFDVGDEDSVDHRVAAAPLKGIMNDTGDHLIIDANATKYFLLRGSVVLHDGTVDNESISTALAGDSAYASNIQRSFGDIDGSGGELVGGDHFIWSDLNFDQYTSSSATANEGWFNGYRVDGLVDNTSTAQVITD